MEDTDELEASVRELSRTLEELQAELRRPPTGPLGLPRPPKPGELLRFTEQYTVPALISLLETNIRLLELLAAAIRVADGRPLDGPGEGGLVDAGRRSLEHVGDGSETLASASRATLERLDEALAELQEAAEGGRPENPEVRQLMSEARELRAEIDEGLSDPGPADDRARETDPDGSEEGEGPVGIDVDEELETIRKRVDDPEDRPDGGPTTGNQG